MRWESEKITKYKISTSCRNEMEAITIAVLKEDFINKYKI
jgi:hypothetical protein